MGLQRDSLISLVTFNSRGSKKGHRRTGSSSQKSTASVASLPGEFTSGSSPLSSPRLTTSSGDLTRPSGTLQTPSNTSLKPATTPWSPLNGCKGAFGSDAPSGSACPKNLCWNLLREVLHGVSPDYPDFFAVHIDSTKAWYRGYIFSANSLMGRLIPFAVRYEETLGSPASDWLTRQPCGSSLSDSVRIVSIEWLLAIPGQRMTEGKIVQLIDELRRLKDPDQRVRFMNHVNTVLGLPIFSRTSGGEIMSVGKYPPLDIVKQQISVAAATKLVKDEIGSMIDKWLPRDLEVELERCGMPYLSEQCVLRLHLRQVSPQGNVGKRLSENYETAFRPGVRCTFRHVLPASPSHLAKLGRTIMVCELFDALAGRTLGFGYGRLDAMLQPESLDRTYSLSVCMYSHSKLDQKSGAPLYKSLVTGGASGLKVFKDVEELVFEATSKLVSHPSFPKVESTVNDYFNHSETVLMEFGEIVILMQPSFLATSVNDPLLIRVEGRTTPAALGQEVGLVFSLPVPLHHVDVQLLNGSTVIATSIKSSREIPVAAGVHKIPLFDVENDETMIGFLNVRQIYRGREQLRPPPVVARIISESIDFSLDAIDVLGFSDLQIWAGPLLTSLFTQLVSSNVSHSCEEPRHIFKALLRLLRLGLSPEALYLFQQYTPTRRLLAAPVACIILHQYCDLLEIQATEIELAFQTHSLLGHFLDLFGVSASDFRPLTQAFMAFFSDFWAPQELLVLCLQHIDELYVVDTTPEIASQVGSVLTAASYILDAPVVVEFYWLLARIARSKIYATVFARQFSSLVLSLAEQFWDSAGEAEQPLEEIRAMMALLIALENTGLESPAFLSLCMSILVMNEPCSKAVPSGPLFEPHRALCVYESERATTMIETSLVIFKLADPTSIPSRAFLNRLESPLDLVYQLCSCACIMADSFVPEEWMSLNCALLQCAIQCTRYAGRILELIAMPDSTMQASHFDKRAWMHVFLKLLKLISDPRLNFGLVRTGMKVSPIQNAAVAQSLVLSGVKSFKQLWGALARNSKCGGYQVQFYDAYELWGYVLLLGFNSEQQHICSIFADTIGSLLEGEYKLFAASFADALKTLLLSLDHMFCHCAPLPDAKLNLGVKMVWPQFKSAHSLLELLCRYLSDSTYNAYGKALAIALKALDVLRTYWSEPFTNGTLIALSEVLGFIKDCGALFMFEKYFGDLVDALRFHEQGDERLAVAYFEAAQLYASAQPCLMIEKSLSPRLPSQPADKRRQMLIGLSLEHCVKAKAWKFAELVMESESLWLKEAGKLEERSVFVTKWLPTIMDGLTLDDERRSHHWYLIKFHGKGFGILSSRELVWETRSNTRLSDAIQALSTMFNSVVCLAWDSPPKLEVAGPYIAILTLSKEGGHFTRSRPIRDQQTELVQYDTVADFPSASGFVEVRIEHRRILDSNETALQDVRSKTEELRKVCYPHRFKQLDLVLSGILNAGVNGGMSRYSDLLSTSEELMNAFGELRRVVDRALEIYGRVCGEELRGQYKLLCDRAQQWRSLLSVESGFI